jgi:hypothetical protein
MNIRVDHILQSGNLATDLGKVTVKRERGMTLHQGSLKLLIAEKFWC